MDGDGWTQTTTVTLTAHARRGLNGDFPETAVFELKKLAVTLSKLPGPTHQSALHIRIYTLTLKYMQARRYGIKHE